MNCKVTKDTIFLTKEYFIGEGAHKAVYMYPKDASLCIKVLFEYPDIDLERELDYRRSRERRKLSTTLLPKYFGTVNTNIGMGYVFERVRDSDGSTSVTLEEFLNSMTVSLENSIMVFELLANFKRDLFKEKIITRNLVPINLLVQKNEGNMKIKIVDNLGSSSKLPLAFYVDFIANKRINKYWNIFVLEMNKIYPKLITREVIEKLKVI